MFCNPGGKMMVFSSTREQIYEFMPKISKNSSGTVFDNASARRTRKNDKLLEKYLKSGINIYNMDISRFLHNS